jgi:CheY-like chemotaxis protein
VLKNLLSNAFKFTEQGEVSLRISQAQDGWSAGHQRLGAAESVTAFIISDTGDGHHAGDAADDLRGLRPRGRHDGAPIRWHGLGLSICRELVHLLGGEITLTSAPGQGSVFTVFMPVGDPNMKGAVHVAPGKPLPQRQLAPAPSHRPAVRRPASPAPAPAVVAAAPPPAAPVAATAVAVAVAAVEAPAAPIALPATPVTVDDASLETELPTQVGSSEFTALVVDDDARNVYALSVLLERHGITVLGASGGREAIATLQNTAGIDIVFMDIMMPLMDGYDTMRALRALPEFADLPIIAVTAKVGADEEGRCSAAGASSYVPKPIDTATLNEAVARWLPHWLGPLTPLNAP